MNNASKRAPTKGLNNPGELVSIVGGNILIGDGAPQWLKNSMAAESDRTQAKYQLYFYFLGSKLARYPAQCFTVRYLC
jgi:hypothetical protein